MKRTSVHLGEQKAVATLQTCLCRPQSAQIFARADRHLNSWRCYGEDNRKSVMHHMVRMCPRWSEECTRHGLFNGMRHANGSQATEVLCGHCYLDDVNTGCSEQQLVNWWTNGQLINGSRLMNRDARTQRMMVSVNHIPETQRVCDVERVVLKSLARMCVRHPSGRDLTPTQQLMHLSR